MLSAGISLFGANPGTFWNFIKDSTSGLPGNCIEKVCRISSLKNNIAKVSIFTTREYLLLSSGFLLFFNLKLFK